MPYQIGQILEGKGAPVCIERDEPVAKALSTMIEHDFSQLPVFAKDQADLPEWLITYEGILRGIRNFKARIDDLRVRDVMIPAPIYHEDDDLFDILDRLKDTNAVLVMHSNIPEIKGIVTSYDTTEYFRTRTEDLMRVEDIESMIKEFIRAGYTKEDGDLDEERLNKSIVKVTSNQKPDHGNGEKVKTFEQLALNDYIFLLIMKETWAFFEPIFGVQRDYLRELLIGVRNIRNALAHFRGDLTADQRDQLKFCMEWLSQRQEEFQAEKAEKELKKLWKSFEEKQAAGEIITEEPVQVDAQSDGMVEDSYSFPEEGSGGGRFAALADWLQSRQGKIDQVQLTFNDIEKIIQSDLPASARNYRAWWANDSISHSHSQLWLDAGWRTTYVNLSQGKVTFSRIQEREKAYITFFTKLLNELRKRADFPVKDVSPDGASWIVIQNTPIGGPNYGAFAFSFRRDRTLRVEFYIDLGKQDQNKAVFDRLHEQKKQFEDVLGDMGWERLDNRRASRIAMYHTGWITDEQGHDELRKWAAETMVKFYNVIHEPAERAINEVLKHD